MTPWGHWPADEARHIIQVSREHADRARRFCQPHRIESTADLPRGGHESDLPACRSCNSLRGRQQAGHPPAPRPGWVAGAVHAQQTRLE